MGYLKSAKQSIEIGRPKVFYLLLFALLFSAGMYLVCRYQIPKEQEKDTMSQIYRYTSLGVWVILAIVIMIMVHNYKNNQGQTSSGWASDPQPVWLCVLIVMALTPLAISILLK